MELNLEKLNKIESAGLDYKDLEQMENVMI